jgi:hypothetical protein
VSEKLQQKAIAEILGVVPRQVHNLVNEGMPSHLEKGKRYFLAAECVPWYVDYKIRTSAPKTSKRATRSSTSSSCGRKKWRSGPRSSSWRRKKPPGVDRLSRAPAVDDPRGPARQAALVRRQALRGAREHRDAGGGAHILDERSKK